MTDHTLHLRPDELDLLLEGRLPTNRTSHIETCEECRSALDELRDVVAQLNALPALEPPAGFSELVMASVRVAPLPVGQHLTADDLDAWLAGALHQEGRNHLWTCTECRQLADAERALVYRLEQLPLFQPGARFEERDVPGPRAPSRPWPGPFARSPARGPRACTPASSGRCRP